MNKYSFAQPLARDRKRGTKSVDNLFPKLMETDRSKTSALVKLENLKMKNRSDSLVNLSKKYQRRSVLSESARKLPSPRDFEQIVKRLDDVIGIKGTVKHIFLGEGLTQYSFLSGTFKCFVISTKNKECPLKLTIGRIKGSVNIYMSKTQQEPNEDKHDKEITQDTLFIKDKGSLFKTPCIFLGIIAVEDANFTLSVQFGVKKPVSSERVEDNMHDTLDEILENKIQKPLPKIRSKTYRKSMVSEWNTRRQLVLHRKDKILKEKKERNIKDLNRHEDRKREAIMLQEIQKVKCGLENAQKLWLRALYCVKVMNVVDEIRNSNRDKILTKLKKYTSIRKIQAAFKCKRTFRIANHPYIAIAILNLKMYYHNAPRQNMKALDFMQASYRNVELELKINDFTRTVELLQRGFKRILRLNRYHKFQILKYWDKVLSSQISSLKNSNKHKKRTLQEYLQIDSQIRDDIIDVFYHERKREYSYRASAYIYSQKETSHNAPSLAVFPVFKYLPSEIEMISLIQKAARCQSPQ